MSYKITYKDGETQEFNADDYEITNDFLNLVKRIFDNDGEYDEDETIAIISLDEIRLVEFK